MRFDQFSIILNFEIFLKNFQFEQFLTMRFNVKMHDSQIIFYKALNSLFLLCPIEHPLIQTF